MKKKTEKTLTVRLPRISGKEDSVFISVGERSWRIQRGVSVSLPESAYDVLRNSEIAENDALLYSKSKN